MKPLHRTLVISLLAGSVAACSEDGGSSSTTDDGIDPVVGVPVASGDLPAEGPFDTPADALPTAPGTGVLPGTGEANPPIGPAAPADTPVEMPVEMPVETPVEAPAETPVETPVEAPAETPVETPVETPTGTPDEMPVGTPVETPSGTPDEQPPIAVADPVDADPTVPGPDTTPVTETPTAGVDPEATPDAGTDPDTTPDPTPDTDSPPIADADPDATPDAPVPPVVGTDPVDADPVGVDPVDTPDADTPPVTGIDAPLVDPIVPLGDFNRTNSEALSVSFNGPRRTGVNRAGGSGPTPPTGLTALLIADNWVELDWVPSADDIDIAEYEIYRDDQLVGTINEEEDNSIEEDRAFRTTTYIDCNYTKDLNCQVVGQPMPGTEHVYTVVAIDDEGNRSAPSAPLSVNFETISPSRVAPSDPASVGYTLEFQEEFEGTRLDRSKFVLKMPWGPDTIVNGEQQYFVDIHADGGENFGYDPFVFNGDGTVRITGTPTPPELLEAANNQPYLSGVLTTRSKFEATYGYAEMRAKVAGGEGLLSTFYLYQPAGNQYEIDILEYDGREPAGATQNYHYRDGFRYADTGFSGVPHASPTMKLEGDVNLSADFHVYSVLWEPELVVWYIDGVEVRRMSGPRVSNQEMDIVAQLVVGSRWIGTPSPDALPAEYQIDYIRFWQR